jgi:hypothetical protein
MNVEYRMKKSILALAFAVSALPLAALAQDTNAPAAPTPEQRQAMRQTFERFAQQEGQLHQQMRSQILSSLSQVHLRAVAATIGQLAISADPDTQAAAKRIDQMLSPAERQRIMTAHETFRTQSRQLHDQMRTAMQSEMPAGHAPMGPNGQMMQHPPLDAGTILLMALTPHPMMGMMHAAMEHMEGAPPQ